MAKALEAQGEQLEAIHTQVTHYLIVNFPEARGNPFIPIAKAVLVEQQVLHMAMQHIEIHRGQITSSMYGELMKRLLLSYETQVALRTTERRIRENNSADVRSRRTFRWQMAHATTEAEKERLRLERKRFIARKWYYNNQAREQAKTRQRNRRIRDIKGCCPFMMLGHQSAPKRSVRLWITQCPTCKRKEYGDLGCNEKGRLGTYFRGEWFDHIDPETGTGTTFAGKLISLTSIY